MTEVLYASLGGSSSTSDLYTVNPATAAMTPIGPIGFALTGLSRDPTTGTMYGITSANSSVHPWSLVAVDVDTGAGTFIGALGATGIGDIAFDAAGQLYGQGQNKFYSIDKVTGAATRVGVATGSGLLGLGSDFDSAGTLWSSGNADTGALKTIDPATGVATTIVAITGASPTGGNLSAFAFDASDVLYVVDLHGSAPVFSNLYKLDVASGVLTLVGALTLTTDAIAWGPAPFADDFSVALTPSSLTLNAGDSGTSALSTTVTSGSAQSVALTATGQPAGVNVSFAPNPITSGGGTTVTVAVSAGVPSGNHSIAIHCVGSLGPSHQAFLSVVVPPSNFGCDTAENLNAYGCPDDGVRTFSNAGAPTTPADIDPLNTVYESAWTFQRQVWFKLTNTSAKKAYARFIFKNTTGARFYFAGALYTGSCGALIQPPLIFNFSFAWTPMEPGDTWTFGAALEPGETVWLQIAGDDLELAAPGLDGNFQIEWHLLTATFTDEIGPNEDFANAHAGVGGPITKELTLIGDRFYFSYAGNPGGGQRIYAASCALDGSDVRTALMPDGLVDVTNKYFFVTDGTDVFFTYPNEFVSANEQSQCAPRSGIDYQFKEVVVMRQGAVGSWAEIGRIQQSTPGGGGGVFYYRACASPAQPGVMWLTYSYNCRTFFTKQAIPGVPPCFQYTPLTWPSPDNYAEVFETFSIDLGTGFETRTDYYRFAQPFGSSRTDYSSLWPRDLFDIVNDEGYPLLFVDNGVGVVGGVPVWDSFVTVKRPDTGAVLRTFSYQDCTGVAIAKQLVQQTGGADGAADAIRAFPRQPDGRRYIACYWEGLIATLNPTDSTMMGVIEYIDGVAALSTLPDSTSGSPGNLIVSYHLDPGRGFYVAMASNEFVWKLDYLCPANTGWNFDAGFNSHAGARAEIGAWYNDAFFWLDFGSGVLEEYAVVRRLPIVRNGAICDIGTGVLCNEPVVFDGAPAFKRAL